MRWNWNWNWNWKGQRGKGAKDLREAIAYADKVYDYVSRDMMIKILAEEEHHRCCVLPVCR
ncbi:hypothetical protein ACZ87_03837 [Candidatus Erwinia dacicola]|uniref:Uncharacterized protein n=1 Tax=Candidatus Erwinia dacicola TaxID=252393 RepID=A0A328TEX4_9GAMM|nr:hypothetical protein ACZ87_03837 [Candidatus Erwinia dacicola]